jgi:hypothetical protein
VAHEVGKRAAFLAADFLQLRAADAGGEDVDEDLSVGEREDGLDVGEDERGVEGGEEGGFHERAISDQLSGISFSELTADR